MEELLKRFVERDRLSIDDIKVKLRNFDFINAPEDDAVVALAELLLHEQAIEDGVFHFAPGTPFNDRMIRLADQGNKNIRRLLCNWLYVAPNYALYPLFLFNSDYGKTKTVLNLFLKSEKATPPPYLFRVLQNMLLHYFPRKQVAPLIANQGNVELWAPVLNEVFETARPVKTWLRKKEQTLRYFGGQTNTILSYYDHLLTPDSGFTNINRNADYYFDLGGGHNTPEMVRMTEGLPFTSCDIIPPTPTKKLVLVKRTTNGESLLDKEHRAEYIEKLKATPYQEFNVFDHSFPTDKDSYVITSTGFLTSTVRASTNGPMQMQFGGNGFYATSLAGVKKIMELVRLGKDVDLFTVNRATSRVYSNKTVFLAFRGGRLASMALTEDLNNRYTNDRKANLLKLIHPDKSPFRPFLELRDPAWTFFPPSDISVEQPDQK